MRSLGTASDARGTESHIAIFLGNVFTMQRLHCRITLGDAIIAVALLGIILAGAVATAKQYPRKKFYGVSLENGNGKWFQKYYENGRVDIGTGNQGMGYHVLETYWNPDPRPTLLEIWFPVLGSSAIAVAIVVAIKWWRGFRLPMSVDPPRSGNPDP